MRFKHYYVMTEPDDGKFTNGKTITSLYEEAPGEVIKAVENPCAWEKPPRDCYKYPPPDKNIPIIKEPVVMRNNDELIAEFIPRNTSNLESRRKKVLATNNNADVLLYNREWRINRLNELAGNRMNEEGEPTMVLHNIQNKTANKDSGYSSYLADRAIVDWLGGAKNKKKQRFRTKRRRSASRRKAPRRRNAPRRRTGKK